MRVFDETKTIELLEYDLTKGVLRPDTLFIKHHEEVKSVEEQGHYRLIAEYPNGGRTVEWVVDVPKVEAKEAWDEYEDIQVYIPYTEEELAAVKQREYEDLVDSLIRERYTLSQELAILRQRDTKVLEFEDYNAYAEQCKITAKTTVYK